MRTRTKLPPRGWARINRNSLAQFWRSRPPRVLVATYHGRRDRAWLHQTAAIERAKLAAAGIVS